MSKYNASLIVEMKVRLEPIEADDPVDAVKKAVGHYEKIRNRININDPAAGIRYIEPDEDGAHTVLFVWDEDTDGEEQAGWFLHLPKQADHEEDRVLHLVGDWWSDLCNTVTHWVNKLVKREQPE